MCAFWILNPHNTVYWHYICLNCSFEAGSWNQIGGWSYIERSERSCVRNSGRTERELVSRKDRCRSGWAVFERRCIRDTARIQRVLIGDRYALQSERVNFLPDHTRPSHKNWSALVVGWSAVWCECSLSAH